MTENTTWFRCACPWHMGQLRTGHSLQHCSWLSGVGHGAMDTALESTLYDHLIVWPPPQPVLPVPTRFTLGTEYWWPIRNHNSHSKCFNQNINEKPAGIFLMRTTKRRCEKTNVLVHLWESKENISLMKLQEGGLKSYKAQAGNTDSYHITPHYPKLQHQLNFHLLTALTVPCLPKA